MKKEVRYALAAYILILIIAFFASIVFDLGEAESRHDPSSLWMYLRRGLMIIAAMALPWFTKRENPLALGWGLSVKWTIIAVLVGIAIGFGNAGGFDPRGFLAIILAIFHTFATELFFRGYLNRTFAAAFESPWLGIILSAFLYGIFYLTVPPVWAQAWIGRILFVLLFTILGIIFAYGYKRSGSFFVPWIMHFFGVLNYRLLI